MLGVEGIVCVCTIALLLLLHPLLGGIVGGQCVHDGKGNQPPKNRIVIRPASHPQTKLALLTFPLRGLRQTAPAIRYLGSSSEQWATIGFTC